MKKIDEAIDIVRGEIPPGAFIKTVVINSGMPSEDLRRHFIGFELSFGERVCTRQEALKVYNAIRFKLPELDNSSFKEEKDLEWVFTLRFLMLSIIGKQEEHEN